MRTRYLFDFALGLVTVWPYVTVFYTPSHAAASVESSGLTDVEITGWAPLACSRDDTVCRSFKAKRGGKTVEGIVGCGLIFKSCTVRSHQEAVRLR